MVLFCVEFICKAFDNGECDFTLLCTYALDYHNGPGAHTTVRYIAGGMHVDSEGQRA